MIIHKANSGIELLLGVLCKHFKENRWVKEKNIWKTIIKNIKYIVYSRDYYVLSLKSNDLLKWIKSGSSDSQ